MATVPKMGDDSPCWYDDQVSFMPEMIDSPRQISHHPYSQYHRHYPFKQELELHYNMPPDPFLQLPQLESPTLPNSGAAMSYSSVMPYAFDRNSGGNLQSSVLSQEKHIQQSYQQPMDCHYATNQGDHGVDQVTDWRVLDKFVASQLSQEDAPRESNYSNDANVFESMNAAVNDSDKQEMESDFPSTSASSCPMDLWK
ncbi:hypothetical protein Nepgr_011350 [Nepenthes gracilis]|uniref:Uncharacterized protein n=1 Tax=Nepenthes gracilis TaxID=150966 RepID=A0AAD3XM87_NEPGR|nr:hypothetical protein Nepgr_011350 [Nepenthes gracilis]